MCDKTDEFYIVYVHGKGKIFFPKNTKKFNKATSEGIIAAPPWGLHRDLRFWAIGSCQQVSHGASRPFVPSQ
jgi:hypothetical protein